MRIVNGNRIFETPSDIIEFYETAYAGEAKRYVIVGYGEDDVDVVAHAVDTSYDFDQDLKIYVDENQFLEYIDIDEDTIVMDTDDDGYWHVAVEIEFDDGEVWSPTF